FAWGQGWLAPIIGDVRQPERMGRQVGPDRLRVLGPGDRARTERAVAGRVESDEAGSAPPRSAAEGARARPEPAEPASRASASRADGAAPPAANSRSASPVTGPASPRANTDGAGAIGG